jgi:hypothetical protein
MPAKKLGVQPCAQGATEQMAARAGAVTGSIQSIAAVSEQQNAATEKVSVSTEQMSTQVEHMSAQAQELARTAGHLTSLVACFRLDDRVAYAAAGTPNPATRLLAPLRRVA